MIFIIRVPLFHVLYSSRVAIKRPLTVFTGLLLNNVSNPAQRCMVFFLIFTPETSATSWNPAFIALIVSNILLGLVIVSLIWARCMSWRRNSAGMYSKTAVWTAELIASTYSTWTWCTDYNKWLFFRGWWSLWSKSGKRWSPSSVLY